MQINGVCRCTRLRSTNPAPAVCEKCGGKILPPKLVDVDGWKILPCAPDVCQACAVDHAPELPHNQQSLYWQYWFYSRNNQRWPTWADACAHCTPEMFARWKSELEKRGAWTE